MPTAFHALRCLAAVAALAAGAGEIRAAAPSCSRYDIESLTVGSPLSYVRTRFGREPIITNLARPGRPDATVVDYVLKGRAIYVEYDHRIDKKPEAKISVLRASLPSTEDALQDAIHRLGTPTISPERKPDQDGNIPAPDGFVWVDPACGIVATVYRRAGSWWSGDVGTFLQIEAIDNVKDGTSAALPYLEGTAVLASLTPPAAPPEPTVETLETAPTEATAAKLGGPAVDVLPQRIAAPPPTYPANLRLMGVTGHVGLVAVIRIDGTVGDVRVVKVEPPGRGFEQAALSGVKRWRYKPATVRGVPTESEVEVNIDFK
ncbi:MAG TPA: energy transducer TonB [Candidatus Polarisedimenticolaceae bacterium]|nr:energy transducer TonB [Candidatus Polarisedimenticolaceae bacterium]